MADWEQPSTSVNLGGSDGPNEEVAELRRDLAAAMNRIESLEARVTELEGAKTRTAGV